MTLIKTEQHTTYFDPNIKSKLKHLVNYPQLLPFICKNWNTQFEKILFLGESHYLPGNSIAINDSTNWYTNTDANLSEKDKNNINTRIVINSADYYCLDKTQYCKAHLIFYNLKSAIFESQRISNTHQAIFDRFAFYNYFQRPAEVTGNSIKNLLADDQLAYQTIREITYATKPTVILFVSKKAYNSFIRINNIEKDSIFEKANIQSVPHPSSPWWNRSIKNNNNLTGRQKFLEIFSGINLSISEI